jgi:hypothetical protein
MISEASKKELLVALVVPKDEMEAMTQTKPTVMERPTQRFHDCSCMKMSDASRGLLGALMGQRRRGGPQRG